MLSRPLVDKAREALLSTARMSLLDYFDSVASVEDISYDDLLCQASLSGSVPGHRFTWATKRVHRSVINSILRNLYDKYKKGELSEDAPSGMANQSVDIAAAFSSFPSQASAE